MTWTIKRSPRHPAADPKAVELRVVEQRHGELSPTRRTKVVEFTDERARRREDRLAVEEPLEVRLSVGGAPSDRVWMTMRTPGHDFELAAGFCFNEGLLSPGAIDRVAYCTDVSLAADQAYNVVTVSVSAASRAVSARHPALSAGSAACGVCGKDSIDDALTVRPGDRWAGQPLAEQVVRGLPDALRAGQKVFSRTGGVHAAGLVDGAGSVLVVREDIGRHNAIDKVVGSRVLRGEPTNEAALVVSGRAGFELVQKAVASGVGALVAVGAPSSLAAELAETSGLQLFGFTSADRTVRYA